ncbi:MAG TPA: M23 family metallopeptidase [Longimicrobiaceae bacterium]|nr:M23 family metallopeptidase [Longimicrobiaceae bacterium]
MRYASGWATWRRAFVAVALLEGAAVAGVVVYLAATGQSLVLAVRPREVPTLAKADRAIIIPVAGVRRADLRDSFHAARSGGRQHLGIDIMAPDGTPVIAAAPGVIVKRDSSGLGGIALYQRGLDGVTIYYYAHLQRYAPEIDEGDLVRQGDVIAYVGHSGNASAGAPHLHFGVYTVTDPNRWWHGRDLNPYAVLTAPDAPAK